MRNHLLLYLCLAGICAGVAAAAPVTYQVTVDTSSISGTAGSIDFNFDPGPFATQAASLTISSFSTNGTLAGSPVITGDVAGALPASLTFDNATAFNDYFEGLTFASELTFDLTLDGPALTSPNGTATSGSTFAFSLFSDAAGTIPVLTTDQTDGFALALNVNLDGSTTVNNYSAQTSITATPEPGNLALAGCTTLFLLGSARLRPSCRKR